MSGIARYEHNEHSDAPSLDASEKLAFRFESIIFSKISCNKNSVSFRSTEIHFILLRKVIFIYCNFSGTNFIRLLGFAAIFGAFRLY